MHRKELYKTTNTGHLVAGLFPESCSVYLWSRTEPDANLLAELSDERRQIVLLFPENQTTNLADRPSQQPDRPLTVILLDGTWKQASRMANLSHWLKDQKRLSITSESTSQHEQQYLRKAPESHQLSTAQAAAWVLKHYNEVDNAELLNHTFAVFNQHCISTRRNIRPIPGPSHHFLEQAKNL